MKKELRNPRTIVRTLALAIAIGMTSSIHMAAATLYVSGPSTNASPLRFKAIRAGIWHSLGVQSNDNMVVVKVRYLLDRFRAEMGDIESLAFQEIGRPGGNRLRLDASAAEQELRLVERIADGLGHLAAA